MTLLLILLFLPRWGGIQERLLAIPSEPSLRLSLDIVENLRCPRCLALDGVGPGQLSMMSVTLEHGSP